MRRRLQLVITLIGVLGLALLLPAALVPSDETALESLLPSVESPPVEALPPVLHRSLDEARGHLDEGRFREALAIYEKALAAAGNHPQARLATLIGQGLAFKKLGDFHQALHLYREAIAIARPAENRERIARLLRNVGSCYISLGEFQLARDSFGEALAHTPSRWYRGLIHTDLATLSDLEGKHEDALKQLRRAFLLLRGAHKIAPETRRRGQAMVLDRLGSAAWNAGHLELAERAYGSSRQLLRQPRSTAPLATLESNIGRLHLERDSPREALGLLQPARKILAEHGLRLDEAAALLGMAQAHRQLGALGPATQALEQALSLIEDLRGSMRNPHLRSMFLANYRKFYDLAIELAMLRFTETSEDTFLHRAISLSEGAKARSLLDLLQEGPRHPRRLEDTTLEARLRPLELELNRLEHRRLALLQRLAPLAEVAAVEKEQRALILENENAWNALRQEGQGSPPPPDVAYIQTLLEDDTCFLVYSLGENKSFLWRINRNDLEAWTLPGRARIESLARQAWRALTLSDQPGGSDLAPLSELGTLLLPLDSTPAAGRRLVIVPDGILHSLPFAALPPAQTGRLLVQDYEIVHLPSISTLEVLRRREKSRPPADGLVAVVYDPVYGPRDPRWPAQTTPRLDRPPRWPRLAYSTREAEAILSRAPATRIGLTGFEARRESLLDGRLGGFQIVHLSVHAELDEEHPELSSLVFAQFDPQGRALDGHLFMHEIDDLKLPAELVVLSACNSARGRMIRGEGLVGLTRAVFLAGANRSLVSLWSVHDEATAELMTVFYDGLLVHRLPPAQALQAAQRHMRASERWRAPYYWAAFVLQGDWRWRLSIPASS